MSRIARVVVPGCPHHVTQRGNNRQDVFFDDDDRSVYLELLREQVERFRVRVHGYCLMSNHVHLILTVRDSPSLSLAVGRTHWCYTQHINRLHGRSGHLWQNRFDSCPLGDEHYYKALAYIERNPVRARMHRLAWKYPFSSAAAHCGGEDASGLLTMHDGKGRKVWGARWKKILGKRTHEEWIEAFRAATNRGRPLAGDSLLSKWERRLGRRLRPLSVGRPRRKRKSRII